jgi:hypothetical protein
MFLLLKVYYGVWPQRLHCSDARHILACRLLAQQRPGRNCKQGG